MPPSLGEWIRSEAVESPADCHDQGKLVSEVVNGASPRGASASADSSLGLDSQAKKNDYGTVAADLPLVPSVLMSFRYARLANFYLGLD